MWLRLDRVLNARRVCSRGCALPESSDRGARPPPLLVSPSRSSRFLRLQQLSVDDRCRHIRLLWQAGTARIGQCVWGSVQGMPVKSRASVGALYSGGRLRPHFLLSRGFLLPGRSERRTKALAGTLHTCRGEFNGGKHVFGTRDEGGTSCSGLRRLPQSVDGLLAWQASTAVDRSCPSLAWRVEEKRRSWQQTRSAACEWRK